MSRLKNVLPTLKKVLPKNIILPNVAESVYTLTKEQFMEQINNGEGIWGTDCLGGLSYFGKTEDILQIQNKIQKKLIKKELSMYEEQFYFLWSNGYYSLLNIYDDENPPPSSENVLRIAFGAACDDEPLIQAIHYKKYITDIFNWQYNGELVDLTKPKQKVLLKEMQKMILLIDNSQVIG